MTQIREPRGCGPLERDSVELGRDLDAVHAAAEPLGEQERRAAAAGRDVEHTRPRVEVEPLAEQDDLLRRGRVLDLVQRLGDDEVAWDHGGII